MHLLNLLNHPLTPSNLEGGESFCCCFCRRVRQKQQQTLNTPPLREGLGVGAIHLLAGSQCYTHITQPLIRKIKQYIAILLLVMGWGGATAQQAPDNDQILKAIIGSNSQYYYPSLMLRYEMGDTTLTLDDYQHLYYGYAWQESYKPLEDINAEMQLLNVLDSTKELEMATEEQARLIIRWGQEVMKADPFSPSNLNFLTYGYVILGDTATAAQYADRLHKVMKTIENSGTGLKEKTPWHILFFKHANDFLAARDQTIIKRTVRTRAVEYVHLLKLKRNDGPKGYFFDFGRVYWKKPENIDQKRRVQGFEINSIPIGRKKGPYNPVK